MKPAPFEYHRPETLDEALALLAEHAGDAKPLAGGQSLVPAMNFRLAQPAVLVDLNRIPSLAGIVNPGAALDFARARKDPASTNSRVVRFGAMTRHQTLERDPRIRAAAPLLSEAMPFVAHPPIRTRGTIGGSIAHADPAAELPAALLALDASVVLRSRNGTRTVPIGDFFVGLYATALESDELVTEIVVPPHVPGSGWAIDEVARRHGDYALAGVAAHLTFGDGGVVAAARIALFGVHERPALAEHAARALVGSAPTDDAIRAAAREAGQRDADPSSDIHASAAFRRHLTEVLVRRVVTKACDRATGVWTG